MAATKTRFYKHYAANFLSTQRILVFQIISYIKKSKNVEFCFFLLIAKSWRFRHLSVRKPFQFTISQWNRHDTNFRTLGMALGMQLRPCLFSRKSVGVRPCLLFPSVGNHNLVLLTLVTSSSHVSSLSKLLLGSRSILFSCTSQSGRCVTSLGCLQLLSCVGVHRRHSQSLFEL